MSGNKHKQWVQSLNAPPDDTACAIFGGAWLSYEYELLFASNRVISYINNETRANVSNTLSVERRASRRHRRWLFVTRYTRTENGILSLRHRTTLAICHGFVSAFFFRVRARGRHAQGRTGPPDTSQVGRLVRRPGGPPRQMLNQVKRLTPSTGEGQGWMG